MCMVAVGTNMIDLKIIVSPIDWLIDSLIGLDWIGLDWIGCIGLDLQLMTTCQLKITLLPFLFCQAIFYNRGLLLWRKDTHQEILLSDCARVLQKLPRIAKTRIGTAFTQERQGPDICPDSFSLQTASTKEKQVNTADKWMLTLFDRVSLHNWKTRFRNCLLVNARLT